ncbi:hypothetical protein Bhyg_09249, partial [Pseudolycoriella hygida]
MDVTVIKGKRENSEHFFISSVDEIYTKHAKIGNNQFVKCYYSENGCKARGKIDATGFHPSDGQYALHSDHEYTTTSTLNFLACFNEMKNEARTSGKMPNTIYDEVMSRYEGMFDQVLTFPNIQSTLLRCRKEYFPRFPQTAEEFYKAFEENSIYERYGHCFEELFYHGVLGNEATGRSAVFYTSKLLEYFNSIKHEIKAFADATFKYQPLYFHQLFIVHFAIGSYTFPAFYVFMERKNIESYQAVFELIRHLGFNIIEIMADFEAAIKNAFLLVFPTGAVYGCHFHLAQ